MGKQNPEEGRKIYRLTFVEDRSHKQLGSVRFSILKLAVVGVSAFVVTALLLYALIALTPLRTTIPGYPDAHFRRQAISNAIRIDSLENSINRWKLYAVNLERVLDGKQVLDLDSMMTVGTAKYISDKSDAEIARQDSLLRLAVAADEQFKVNTGRKALPVEGMQFFRPLNGVVTKGFDGVLHRAVDIQAPANSVVCAVLSGTVIHTGWSDETGYLIEVQHQGNLISIYSGNEKLLKSAGDKVEAGTPIALVGSSTDSVDGAHLHFELWLAGEALDPCKYIKF